MEEENYYNMQAHCNNCGEHNEIPIPKGTKTDEHDGECPNCGVKDLVVDSPSGETPDRFHDPYPHYYPYFPYNPRHHKITSSSFINADLFKNKRG